MKTLQELEPGTFFLATDGTEKQIFRLLKTQPEVLVAAYWPSSDPENLRELKSNCTEYPARLDALVEALDYLPITAQDAEAIATFERIREAKKQRVEAYHELIVRARQLMAKEHWDLAIAVLNEAAPYNKLDPEIYKLRGMCFMRTDNNLLAKSDLDFYLETQDDAEIRELLKSL